MSRQDSAGESSRASRAAVHRTSNDDIRHAACNTVIAHIEPDGSLSRDKCPNPKCTEPVHVPRVLLQAAAAAQPGSSTQKDLILLEYVRVLSLRAEAELQHEKNKAEQLAQDRLLLGASAL